MTIPSGATTWQSDLNWSSTLPTRFKTTPAKVTPSRSGHHPEPPQHRPHRRNRSLAGRQRHQSPRPATNRRRRRRRRRRPTRNSPRPLETTPRPTYRLFHLPASRCEGRRATGRTQRTQSKRRQAAPVPNTRSTSKPAGRTRPLTTVELLQRGCGSPAQSWHAAMAADRRIGFQQGQGGAARRAAAPRVLASLRAASRRSRIPRSRAASAP